MIFTETWQQLGDMLYNGGRVYVNDAFRLFRKADNERILSLGSRFTHYMTTEHPCAYLYGSRGYLQKLILPVLDNWAHPHANQIPVADPGKKR